MAELNPLTFAELRSINLQRCEASFHPLEAWSPCDWATAMAGECGEVCNEIKKLRRRMDGLQLANTPEEPVIRRAIAKELGDLLAYVDLLAARLGIDLGEAVASKFNEVSERVHSPFRLPVLGDCHAGV